MRSLDDALELLPLRGLIRGLDEQLDREAKALAALGRANAHVRVHLNILREVDLLGARHSVDRAQEARRVAER